MTHDESATVLQVCLTAEKCRHVQFDARPDMWWGNDAFTCGDALRGPVTFSSVLLKVCVFCCTLFMVIS